MKNVYELDLPLHGDVRFSISTHIVDTSAHTHIHTNTRTLSLRSLTDQQRPVCLSSSFFLIYIVNCYY